MADQAALTLVQDEKTKAFNQLVETHQGAVDLSDAHLRSYDLRRFQLTQANLSGAYLRAADLRGLDLSQANLVGASLKDAKVSGTLLPTVFSADEITMSLLHGTRLRPTQG